MPFLADDFEPCFLIATPQLQDPNFRQTVLVLMEMRTEGAVGFIINRQLDVTLDAVHTNDVTIADEYLHDELWFGGPVEPNHILCLYDRCEAPVAGDSPIIQGLALAPASTLLADNEPRYTFPGKYRIIAGHAGWAPQQLDEEIQHGAWLTAPISKTLIFDTPAPHIWQRAYSALGIDPTHLHHVPTTSLH